MNRIQSSKLIFIVTFLGLIYAPLLGRFSKIGTTDIEDFKKTEKRSPCVYPGIPRSIPELEKFPSSFENAFNDHLPFREILIRIHGGLSFHFLKISPHKQLLIGRNGHCFLASHADGNNDLIFNSLEITSQRITQLTEELREKERFIKDLKVPVLIVAIPTSPLFEFHNIPLFLQKQIDPAFLEIPPMIHVMINLSKEFSEKYLLYPYEKAMEANKEYPLFPEKNFHWQTSRYTKLTASCIADRFGIAPYENPGFDEFEKQRTISDLSQFMGTTLFNRHDLVYKSGIWDTLNIRDKNPADVYKNYPDFPWCLYTVNPSKKTKLLIVGDSFTPPLRFDLARHFGEVLSLYLHAAVRQSPALQEWVRFVFEDIQPDYIVFLNHNEFAIKKAFIDNFYLIASGE